MAFVPPKAPQRRRFARPKARSAVVSHALLTLPESLPSHWALEFPSMEGVPSTEGVPAAFRMVPADIAQVFGAAILRTERATWTNIRRDLHVLADLAAMEGGRRVAKPDA